LEALQSEGELDSRGKFTVDLGHARERLANCLLEKTEDLLVKLVQAGVAAGANRLDLESKSTHITFTMYGAVFPKGSLGKILNYILGDSESEHRCLRHLAMAVNTAISTRPTAIALAEWDGKDGKLYRWTNQGKTVSPWTPSGAQTPLATFQLIRTPEEYRGNLLHMLFQRDLFSMFRGTKAGWDADMLMLHEKACWCPVPIHMNGRLMDEGYLAIGKERGTHEPLNLKHKSEYRLASKPLCGSVRITRREVLPWPGHQFPQPPCGAILTGGPEQGKVSVSSLIHFTVDGVLAGTYSIGGIPKNSFIRAVVAADNQETDLTGLKLVGTHELFSLGDWALQHASQMYPAAGLGAAPELYVNRVG